MRSRISLLAALGLVAGVALAQSQTLPAGYEAANFGGTSGNPFGSGASQRAQNVIDSGQFAFQAPLIITQIYIRSSSPTYTAAPFTWTNLEIKLSSCPNNFNALSTSFIANQGPDMVVARTGPFTTPAIAATTNTTADWIQLTLTTPFNYNPALGKDLCIDIAKCGGAIPSFVGDYSYTGAACSAMRSTAGCTTLTGASTLFVPVFKIDYVPNLPSDYQVNSADSSFDINGVAGGAFVLAEPSVCVNNVATVNFGSANVGLPWDLLIGGAPIKSRSAGALTTGSGQLVNMDFADPSLSFFNGLTLTTPFFPASLPVGVTVPFDLSLQQFNIAPTNPDGLALSQPVRFHSTALATSVTKTQAQLPDDASSAYLQFGAAPSSPTCYSPIPNIPFYGTVQTAMHVLSNGRVMFDNGALTTAILQDWTPTAATGASGGAWAGFWSDFEPNLTPGSQMTIDWSTGTLVTVTYTNHRWWGDTTNAGLGSATVAFDIGTGAVVLSGVNSFAPQTLTAVQMMLGMSQGNGATDAGAAIFAPTTSGSVNVATDMIYELGLGGTLAAGTANIVFTPAPGFGYTWAAF